MLHRRFAPTLVVAIAALAQSAGGQSVQQNPATAEPSLQPLLEFREAEIKFSLRDLMEVLRDRDHEGWVLAAYPDPVTGRPLIGAGFSLDVDATDHPQLDPLNPRPFVEPSSAQLWAAAGLEPERLRQVLDRFGSDVAAWPPEVYRRKIKTRALPPDITDEQALRLLRVSAIQAVVNARAYCRDFDRLNGPQQMALSELVFQMGVNLGEFVEFLSELNGDTYHRDLARPDLGAETDAQHWRYVQTALLDSQWARRYAIRASRVIAMFDPDYARSPRTTEARIEIVLRPPRTRSRRKAATLRAASHGRRSGSRSGHPPRKPTASKPA